MRPGKIWFQCESVSLIDVAYRVSRCCFQGDFVYSVNKLRFHSESVTLINVASMVIRFCSQGESVNLIYCDYRVNQFRCLGESILLPG